MSKPISPLRQRMIDDMTFRNMSPSTHKVYTYAVANFSTFHGRSPDKLGIEDVREYRLHLIARGLKANSINPIIEAAAETLTRPTGQTPTPIRCATPWVSPPNVSNLVDKQYADGLGFSGAGVVDATSIAKRVVQLATQTDP